MRSSTLDPQPGHASSSEPLLAEMERVGGERGIPISDPEVGRLLELLARSCNARRMLEIGTAIGYGALCLARGAPAATVVTVTTGTLPSP